MILIAPSPIHFTFPNQVNNYIWQPAEHVVNVLTCMVRSCPQVVFTLFFSPIIFLIKSVLFFPLHTINRANAGNTKAELDYVFELVSPNTRVFTLQVFSFTSQTDVCKGGIYL
jgi:hypothetical protein